MKKKFLIIAVFILALFISPRVEAASNTEYISSFLATIKYIPKGEFIRDEVNGDYYSQTYQLYTDNIEIDSYTIKEINNLPKGSFVANADTGNAQTTFSRSDKKFKIMVPAQNAYDDFLGEIKVYMDFKGIVHMYGKEGELLSTKIEGANEQVKVLDNRQSKMKINAIDVETYGMIEGVEIEVRDDAFGTTEKFVSSQNEPIEVEKLGEGSATINVLKIPDNYKIDDLKRTIEIGYSMNNEYNLELRHKKGNLHLKDNIPGGVFEIYNYKGIMIGKYETDSEGNINIEDLNIGNYLIIQKEVPADYLVVEDIKCTIKEDENCEIEISNCKKEETKDLEEGEIGDDNKNEESKEEVENKEDKTEENKPEDGEQIKETEDDKKGKEDINESNKNDEEKAEEDNTKYDGNDKEQNNEETKEPESKKETYIEKAEEIKENEQSGVENEKKKETEQEKEVQETEIKTLDKNQKLKTLPRTGNDYFEVKVMFTNSILFIILMTIYFSKKEKSKKINKK